MFFFCNYNVRMHEAIIREFMTALRTYYAKLTQGKPFSGVETGLFRLYMY